LDSYGRWRETGAIVPRGFSAIPARVLFEILFWKLPTHSAKILKFLVKVQTTTRQLQTMMLTTLFIHLHVKALLYMPYL